MTPRVGRWTADPDGQVTLHGNRCRTCGEVFFPERAYCPRCRSTELESADLRGPARLLSFSVVHQAPAGFDTPLAVGYGVLEGEAVVLAPIDGPPASLHKGMELRLAHGVTSRDKEGTEFVSYRYATAEPAGA